MASAATGTEPVVAPLNGAPQHPATQGQTHPESDRRVLVADANEARGKASAEALDSWGMQPHRVQDGAQAMLSVQRLLPATVVLDAALPGMSGGQICEVIKRNESLRDTKVVLVGSGRSAAEDPSPVADGYGADAYIEPGDLPEGLESVLRDLGVALSVASPGKSDRAAANTLSSLEASPEVSAGPVVASPPEMSAGPVVESPPEVSAGPVVESSPDRDEDPQKTEERERARRLARIAVSEMLLYQPEKFEQGICDENLEQVLCLEIQEAQALLRQRIGDAVRAETDFVLDELHRVVSQRSAQR